MCSLGFRNGSQILSGSAKPSPSRSALHGNPWVRLTVTLGYRSIQRIRIRCSRRYPSRSSDEMGRVKKIGTPNLVTASQNGR